MAHRFLSSTNRFSARFAFMFTVSLSCTYLCYNIIFCRSTIMTNQGYEGKRCPPSKNAGGKKLLGKLDDCASQEVRYALHDSAAQRGPSDLRDQQKVRASSGSNWADMKLKNMTVAQKYGSKKLPNALIVGVKKGGTRAVLEFIRIHPDVRALGTEPHFFDRNYDRGLDWYSLDAINAIV
ncbi:Heparan sulfate glucosamine 3-O-sulfotransferase 2 [Channa argus]|uniref:Sulfotransferase n=1 Tax=Channa argus TaxID=215402 RepID=A0A6G1QCJ4_CHAAH|nr:Heparan sulfate glucosamine 3-O-sulfotransferase 2 [Channa argus]